jgi:putative inorganic carbon (hco3(-)) transporter
VQRALLILLVAASYLLLAGADPATLAALAVFAIALNAAALSRILTDIRHDRSLDLALIAIASVLLIQAIPLPASIVNTLSPARATVTASVHVMPLGGAPPAWSTLSIDPRSSWIALATFLVGVLTFWGARATFGAGGNTRAFCRALTVLAAAFAALALVQRAIAPRTVLFILEPEARSANPLGAFVNRNHFAAWLLLACGPVTGYFIARLRTHPSRDRVRFSIGQVMSSGIVFTGLAVGLIIGTLLLVLSRSAVAGLGAAAIAGWWLGRPHLRIERTSLPTVLGFVGATLLVFVLFVDTDAWATRLQQSFATDVEFSRVRIWQESLPMVRDFWATGTGAGTYSEAMMHYQESRVWVGSMQRWAHFNNAHSHYLQVMAEGGLLLLLPVIWALAATTLLGIRAIRADKGEVLWIRVGAAAALVGLAVQSLWEVALTMPANAMLTGALAGLLLYRRDRRVHSATHVDRRA